MHSPFQAAKDEGEPGSRNGKSRGLEVEMHNAHGSVWLINNQRERRRSPEHGLLRTQNCRQILADGDRKVVSHR